MKEEWLFPGVIVPVDMDTTSALVTEIKRLIDVIGGLVLKQGPDYERGFVDGMSKQAQSSVDKAVNAMAQPAQEPVAFKIYLPKAPRQDVVHGMLPWVYDQDPSSGNVASMWVTPIKATTTQPAQKPLTDADRKSYQAGHNAGVAHHKQVMGERNFCHRCGKRLLGPLGPVSIHTCCPPNARTFDDYGNKIV